MATRNGKECHRVMDLNNNDVAAITKPGGNNKVVVDANPSYLKPPKHYCATVWLKLRVVILAALLIVAQTLQVISFKKAGYSYGPYPYMILIFVSATFVPLFGAAAWFISCRSGGFLPQMTSCRFKAHFCIIGLFNALNGILIIFSNPHVSGVLQSILAQAVIPFTLILSIVWLRTRYVWYQYIGAITVVGGVAVSLVPTFEPTSNKSSSTSYFETSDSDTDAIIWSALFALGQIPQALCGIYQEKVFVNAPFKVNVVYMLAWASLSQFLVLACFFPVNFVPWFGSLAVTDVLPYLRNSTECLLHTDAAQQQCSQALPDIVFCILSMLTCNLVQALLVKYSSAVLSVFVITLVTPVSAFAFTLRFLMGNDVETVDPLEIVALGILMVGIFTYRGKTLMKGCGKKNKNILHDSHQSVGTLQENLMSHNDYTHEDNAVTVKDAHTTKSDHISNDNPRFVEAPELLNSRSGIIYSEYTSDGFRSAPILFAGTLKDPSVLDSATTHSKSMGLAHSFPSELSPYLSAGQQKPTRQRSVSVT